MKKITTIIVISSSFTFLLTALYFNLFILKPLIKDSSAPKTVLVPSPALQSTTIPTVISDNRRLLTSVNAYSENVRVGGMAGAACQEEFNQEKETTYVMYKNPEKGIELSVPYNPLWASQNYKVNPYDEDKYGISFGPFSIYEGCSWLRMYGLSFKPAMDKASLKKEIVAQNMTILKNINEMKVGDYELLWWPIDGPGCLTDAEILGKKYNYRIAFNGNCDQSDLVTIRTLVSWLKIK